MREGMMENRGIRWAVSGEESRAYRCGPGYFKLYVKATLKKAYPCRKIKKKTGGEEKKKKNRV